MTAGAGVWVSDGAGTVARIDPSEPRILRRITTGSRPTAIAAADGAVWTTGAAAPETHRGGTLHVLTPVARPEPLTLDWLTVNGYFWSTTELTSLVYDGLVAYRRAGGTAGATIVGALATNVPAPSADGRTYVFTLRDGLRFSDGRPVRPEEFRTSMERYLRRTRDAFPPYYAGIVGAERCMRTPGRCDLSRGIETDERARTITIHLTRPDGEFLHKLAIQFAYVVPADSSGAAGRRPAPARDRAVPGRVLEQPPRRGARAQSALPARIG